MYGEYVHKLVHARCTSMFSIYEYVRTSIFACMRRRFPPILQAPRNFLGRNIHLLATLAKKTPRFPSLFPRMSKKGRGSRREGNFLLSLAVIVLRSFVRSWLTPSYTVVQCYGTWLRRSRKKAEARWANTEIKQKVMAGKAERKGLLVVLYGTFFLSSSFPPLFPLSSSRISPRRQRSRRLDEREEEQQL